MERSEKTNMILRQFRKKSKRVVNKDLYTEFFYLNKNRKAIEFLQLDNKLIVESFFKQFIQNEFKDFVSIEILNDSEEEIKVWFYDTENLVIIVKVNWGFKKQEISIDLDINNFTVLIIDNKENVIRDVDYILLNDYLISFLTIQAESLAQSFEKLSKK